MIIDIIILISPYVVIGMMFIVDTIFRNCKHPERCATFLFNVSGDNINHYGGRSLWIAKWWPFILAHKSLKE